MPIGIMPAARRRVTQSAVYVEMRPRQLAAPAVVCRPSHSRRSFNAMGMPCSGLRSLWTGLWFFLLLSVVRRPRLGPRWALTLALVPGHAVHSARYEAAMRARNKLLADKGRAWDEAWLGALEAQMAEHGAAIHVARTGLVAQLGEALVGQAEGPFARPQLALSDWEGADRLLEQALREGRRRDAGAGRTLAGPHRSDLLVTHQAKGQAAALCSTGEQKALLLSILLAHASLVGAERGQPPVLLLDEVAAHLDPARRLALFERARGGDSFGRGRASCCFANALVEALFARFVTAVATWIFRRRSGSSRSCSYKSLTTVAL